MLLSSPTEFSSRNEMDATKMSNTKSRKNVARKSTSNRPLKPSNRGSTLKDTSPKFPDSDLSIVNEPSLVKQNEFDNIIDKSAIFGPVSFLEDSEEEYDNIDGIFSISSPMLKYLKESQLSPPSKEDSDGSLDANNILNYPVKYEFQKFVEKEFVPIYVDEYSLSGSGSDNENFHIDNPILNNGIVGKKEFIKETNIGDRDNLEEAITNIKCEKTQLSDIKLEGKSNLPRKVTVASNDSVTDSCGDIDDTSGTLKISFITSLACDDLWNSEEQLYEEEESPSVPVITEEIPNEKPKKTPLKSSPRKGKLKRKSSDVTCIENIHENSSQDLNRNSKRRKVRNDIKNELAAVSPKRKRNLRKKDPTLPPPLRVRPYKKRQSKANLNLSEDVLIISDESNAPLESNENSNDSKLSNENSNGVKTTNEIPKNSVNTIDTNIDDSGAIGGSPSDSKSINDTGSKKENEGKRSNSHPTKSMINEGVLLHVEAAKKTNIMRDGKLLPDKKEMLKDIESTVEKNLPVVVDKDFDIQQSLTEEILLDQALRLAHQRTSPRRRPLLSKSQAQALINSLTGEGKKQGPSAKKKDSITAETESEMTLTSDGDSTDVDLASNKSNEVSQENANLQETTSPKNKRRYKTRYSQVKQILKKVENIASDVNMKDLTETFEDVIKNIGSVSESDGDDSFLISPPKNKQVKTRTKKITKKRSKKKLAKSKAIKIRVREVPEEINEVPIVDSAIVGETELDHDKNNEIPATETQAANELARVSEKTDEPIPLVVLKTKKSEEEEPPLDIKCHTVQSLISNPDENIVTSTTEDDISSSEIKTSCDVKLINLDVSCSSDHLVIDDKLVGNSDSTSPADDSISLRSPIVPEVSKDLISCSQDSQVSSAEPEPTVVPNVDSSTVADTTADSLIIIPDSPEPRRESTPPPLKRRVDGDVTEIIDMDLDSPQTSSLASTTHLIQPDPSYNIPFLNGSQSPKSPIESLIQDKNSVKDDSNDLKDKPNESLSTLLSSPTCSSNTFESSSVPTSNTRLTTPISSGAATQLAEGNSSPKGDNLLNLSENLCVPLSSILSSVLSHDDPNKSSLEQPLSDSQPPQSATAAGQCPIASPLINTAASALSPSSILSNPSIISSSVYPSTTSCALSASIYGSSASTSTAYSSQQSQMSLCQGSNLLQPNILSSSGAINTSPLLSSTTSTPVDSIPSAFKGSSKPEQPVIEAPKPRPKVVDVPLSILARDPRLRRKNVRIIVDDVEFNAPSVQPSVPLSKTSAVSFPSTPMTSTSNPCVATPPVPSTYSNATLNNPLPVTSQNSWVRPNSSQPVPPALTSSKGRPPSPHPLLRSLTHHSTKEKLNDESGSDDDCDESELAEDNDSSCEKEADDEKQNIESPKKKSKRKEFDLELLYKTPLSDLHDEASEKSSYARKPSRPASRFDPSRSKEIERPQVNEHYKHHEPYRENNSFPNPTFVQPNRNYQEESEHPPAFPANFRRPTTGIRKDELSKPDEFTRGPRRSDEFPNSRRPGEFPNPRRPEEFPNPRRTEDFSNSRRPEEFSNPRRPEEFSNPRRPEEFPNPRRPGEFPNPRRPGEFPNTWRSEEFPNSRRPETFRPNFRRPDEAPRGPRRSEEFPYNQRRSEEFVSGPKRSAEGPHHYARRPQDFPHSSRRPDYYSKRRNDDFGDVKHSERAPPPEDHYRRTNLRHEDCEPELYYKTDYKHRRKLNDYPRYDYAHKRVDDRFISESFDDSTENSLENDSDVRDLIDGPGPFYRRRLPTRDGKVELFERRNDKTDENRKSLRINQEPSLPQANLPPPKEVDRPQSPGRVTIASPPLESPMSPDEKPTSYVEPTKYLPIPQ